MGIAKDRAFHTEEIRKIYEKTGNLMGKAEESTGSLRKQSDSLQSLLGVLESGLPSPGLRASASELSSSLPKTKGTYTDYASHLKADLQRISGKISLGDAEIGKNLSEAVSVTGKAVQRTKELKELVPGKVKPGSYHAFKKKIKDLGMKWEKEDEDLDKRMSKALAALKGGDHEYMQQSADPVNLSTGNFLYKKTDLVIRGIPELSFTRHYNSVDERRGIFGRGWSHSHEMHLIQEEESLTVVLEDGEEQTFVKKKDGTCHGSGTTAVLRNRDGAWEYRTRDGKRTVFDADGNSIREIHGDRGAIVRSWTEGRLERVTRESDGMSLYLSYDEEGHLSGIQDDTGRSITYSYEGEQLALVQGADGTETGYRYDAGGNLEEVLSPAGIIGVHTEYDSENRAVKQTFPDGSTMEFSYEEEGQVLLTERNQSRTVHCHNGRYQNTKTIHEDGEETYAYNSRGQLTLYRDALGNTTRHAYDSRGNLTRTIDAMGNKVNATYDADNHLMSLTRNGEMLAKLAWDRQGHLTCAEDNSGNRTEFLYGEETKHGRPEQVRLADGAKIRLTYDENGNLTGVTDAWGNTTRYAYDSLNRRIRSTGPRGEETHYEYDDADRLCAVTDALGNRTEYTYGAGGKRTGMRTSDGIEESVTYNALNLPESHTDANGNTTRYEYDEMWNLKTVYHPDGGKEHYHYDKRNRLIQKTGVLGETTRYEYDAAGRCIRETDALGNVTGYAYDALGRITGHCGPQGEKESYEYDGNGNLVCETDANGYKTHYEYNAAGLLHAKTDVMGNRTEYSYTVLGDIETVTDAEGGVITFEREAGGRLRALRCPDGTSQTYRYDESGNLIERSGPGEESIRYGYDLLNRVITMEGNLGQKESYDYDAQGNLISVTDAMGNTTKREYDRNGNLCAVTDAAGTRTLYAYDAMDRLIRVCMGGTDLCTYERDHAGNILTETDALGRSTYYGYDLLGRAVLKKDRDRYETRYRYTPSGKREEILYGDGRRAQYHYDAAGNLTGVEDWNGTTTFINDALGRVVQTIYPGGESVSCRYGTRGERTGLVYPDGTEAEYRYGKGQRLEELLTRTGEGAEESIRYRYDEKGRLAEKELPNGVHIECAYNQQGKLKHLQSRNKYGIIDHFCYEYDIIGRLSGVQKERSISNEENGFYSYEYDVLGRLTDIQKDGELYRKYTYDIFGNRIKKESYTKNEKQETVYRYSETGELLFEKQDVTEKQYHYDKRGNLNEICENGKTIHRYRYGAINRMEESESLSEKVTYLYDGLENRVGLKSNGKKVTYTVDYNGENQNVISIENGRERENDIWDDRLALLKNSKGVYSYLTDVQGSPLDIFDEKGTSIEQYGYDEFGNDLYENADRIQPFGYTGYMRDSNAETLYAKAREYMPEVGRFTAHDIRAGYVDVPLSQNRYIYCFNSPMMFVDKTGEWPSASEADKWVSEVIRWVLDNTWNKYVYGIDDIKVHRTIDGLDYVVKVHSGGKLIVQVIEPKENDKCNINMGVMKLIITKEKEKYSWKVVLASSVTTEIRENENYTISGGYAANEDGVGKITSISGGYENLPFPLPDETEIEDYTKLSWSLTYEDEKHNWKQIKDVVMAILGVGVLMGILADDLVVEGAVDDPLIPGVLLYIADKSPTIYNFLIKNFPVLEKMAKAGQSCL